MISRKPMAEPLLALTITMFKKAQIQIRLTHDIFYTVLLGMLRSLNTGLSTPTPIAFKPLSTYITAPVIAEASGDARNAAVFPTSSTKSFFQRIGILITA